MEKKMNVFDWNQLAPPKDEWVWAAYSLEKKDFIAPRKPGYFLLILNSLDKFSTVIKIHPS